MADQSQQVPPRTTGGSGPSGPRAGFGSRLGAALVDWVITTAVVQGIALATGNNLFEYTRTDASVEFHFRATGWLAIVLMALPLVYYAFLEGGASGQTLGKKLLSIKVADFDSGGPIGFGRGALRYIGRIASAFACFLGYLWMLWDSEKQTWHDKIAQTVVVPAS
jgi:uncharacterized RDD family membrane protein YckC